MYDIEEPPVKISKTEMNTSHNEGVEDGQEEWLSEDMLTDDDQHDADPTKSESNMDTSQEELDEMFLDETMLSGEHSMDSHNVTQTSQHDDSIESATLPVAETGQKTLEPKKPVVETIEQTLNNLEDNSQDNKDKEEDDQTSRKSDGNDTDDLLRLLGDNDEKTKKKVLVKTKEKNGVNRGLKSSNNDDGESSDDDDFVFNDSTVKKLRLAKSALSRKPAARAEPEDFDDDETDCSSDEVTTMKNIFTATNNTNVAKNTAISSQLNEKNTPKKVVKIVETIVESTTKKPTPKRPVSANQSKQPQPQKTLNKRVTRPVRTTRYGAIMTPSKERNEKKPPPPEHDEIIDEDEFMEEDDNDLDEDFVDHSDEEMSKSKQQIMKPEEMDEEIPTDFESQSDSDGMDDIYDEVPSPDSEDRDDWFSLDIRAERASEYLPLLGDKAFELLSSEKQRVSLRLASLRRSVANLQGGGRQQALQLRKAAAALKDLDEALKAS